MRPPWLCPSTMASSYPLRGASTAHPNAKGGTIVQPMTSAMVFVHLLLSPNSSCPVLLRAETST